MKTNESNEYVTIREYVSLRDFNAFRFRTCCGWVGASVVGVLGADPWLMVVAWLVLWSAAYFATEIAPQEGR